MDKIYEHTLQTYQSRMGLVFDKFRHALSLDLINKRLLEVMKRDPLTNVNNRMAYEDKEVFLQSEINSGSAVKFAIAMFDVNNLKLINDSSQEYEAILNFDPPLLDTIYADQMLDAFKEVSAQLKK